MSKIGHQFNTSTVLIKRPRVTEKSTRLSTRSSGGLAYTFEVAPEATKPAVRAAIRQLYGVMPVKISIVNLPAKRFVYRGHPGRKSGLKKAIVYLKSGDKIEFV